MREQILNLIKSDIEFFNGAEELKIEEIGDGNVNYIYKVYDDEHSVIVKFADDYIRGSNTRKLSTKRNKIENIILKMQGDLSKGQAPDIYLYSEELNCIVMEDLSDYYVLREALKDKILFEDFAEEISSFLYNTLFKTTDLVMDVDVKKNLAGSLVNIDMCEISERLVFTEPYMNNQGLNSYDELNDKYVEEKLYKNDDLHCEVGKLKNKFMNNTQSMLHGDLHAGSIFIKEGSMKVFDPEFAFYGPMGYDIGNILASLLISYCVAYFENGKKSNDFTNWLENTCLFIIDNFIDLYEKNYETDVKTYMFSNEKFKTDYLSDILSDTAGYAGTEMIRRTVGVAKVWDLERIEDEKYRAEVEKNIIEAGIELIMKRDSFHKSSRYKDIINILGD